MGIGVSVGVGLAMQAAPSGGGGDPPVTPNNTLRTGVNNTPALAESYSPISDTVYAAARPIIINPAIQRQVWQGVGFAMTESSSERFSVGLSAGQRTALFNEIFGTNGFSYLRVSFGSTDQTYRKTGSNFNFYSYDDVDVDGTLTNFSTSRDDEYVVPRVLEALAINPNLRVVGCCWSPPGYFKKNGILTNASGTNEIDFTAPKMTLLAEYFVKSIQSWQAKGVPIYAISPANEFTKSWGFPSCVWTPAQLADFIKTYLGPALAAASLTTKIWVGDESTDLSSSVSTVLSDAAARAYIDTASWHPYNEDGSPLSTVRASYPTINHYAAEYRSLFSESLADVVLNWAARLTSFGRNWSQAFIGWGGALNETGQPNWSNGRRGMVTISSANDGTITRNPEYYALSHLGRSVPRGSAVIDATQYGATTFDADVTTLAFRKPDGTIVVFAANLDASNPKDVTFVNIADGKAVSRTLGPREMLTLTMQSTWTAGTTLAAPGNFNGIILASATRIWWSPVAGALGYIVYRGSAPLAVVPAGQTYFEDATAGTVNKIYAIRAIGNGLGAKSADLSLTPTSSLRTDVEVVFAAPLVAGVANTGTFVRKSPGSTIAWSCSDGQSGSSTTGTFAFTPGSAGAITFSFTETKSGAANSPVATGPQAYTIAAASVTGQQIMLDTFTGTTNANISSRAMDSGASWSYKSSTGAGSGTITLTAAGTTQGAGTMPSTAKASVTPIHGDVSATAIFARTTGGTVSTSVGVRCDGTAMSGYYASYDLGSGLWAIQRRDAGTSTTLASSASPAFATSSSKSVELRARGSQISLYVDGALVAGPVTDESYWKGGVDLRHAGATGAALGLDRLEVTYA